MRVARERPLQASLEAEVRPERATWAIAVGALVRLAAFPFAEDHYGDAPIRSDIAQAWAHHPGLWWDYSKVCQYGPLPVHLEGALAWLGLSGNTGLRVLPLAFGIAALPLVARLARRLGGSAAFATWALALSPLHIQASTTCASEALFLVFCLVVIEAALDRRMVALALASFAATTTRYDSWLWVPPLALWLLWRHRARVKSIVMCGLLGLGPLSILLANALALGRPLRPLQHIADEHVGLVRDLLARFGLGWHLLGALFWPAATLVALTPLFGLLAFRALRPLPRGERLVPAIVALVPPAIYVARDLLTGAFLPLLRMAGVPAELVATWAPRPSRRVLLACIGVGLAFDLGALALAQVPGPLQPLASRASPVMRLPNSLRAGVRAIREARGPVALDQSTGYEDIVIAHQAGRDRFALYSPAQPPARIVAIRGAKLDAELRATGHALGRTCTLSGEAPPVSWWDCE